MRLVSGWVLLFLGTMLLEEPPASAQGVVFPQQPPRAGNESAKKLLETYEKMRQEPTYEIVDIKNARGELIRMLGAFGHPEKAIELCEEILATSRARGQYGELSSVWLIQELVRLHISTGRHDRAIAVQKEYVDWCAQQYGDRSSDTFMARGQLLKVYLAAKQNDRASALAGEILTGMRQPSEEKIQLLGEIYQVHVANKDYEKQLESALQMLEVITALQQPRWEFNAQYLRINTADAFLRAGKKEFAERLIDHEWNRLIKAVGPDDPKTLAALRAGGGDYLALQLTERAAARFTELVERLTKQSGADHVETLTARNQLAEAYRTGRDIEKAQQQFKELYTTTREKLGLDNPLTGQVVFNLCGCLEEAKKFGDAEPYYREYVEIQKKVTRANDSPSVTTALTLLGMNLLKQEKWAEAEKALNEALEIRRKKEAFLWSTHNSESLLGAALLGQKKYQEAEPLLLAGAKGLQARRFTIPAAVQTQRVNEAIERVIRLYEATEQPDKAEEYRKLLRK